MSGMRVFHRLNHSSGRVRSGLISVMGQPPRSRRVNGMSVKVLIIFTGLPVRISVRSVAFLMGRMFRTLHPERFNSSKGMLDRI